MYWSHLISSYRFFCCSFSARYIITRVHNEGKKYGFSERDLYTIEGDATGYDSSSTDDSDDEDDYEMWDVAAWLSARMPGTMLYYLVLVNLTLLINSELRLIGLQPLVWSAAVTAVNAATLTPARSVSDETSTSLLATPLVLTLRWHRLSRSLLRGRAQRWLHVRQWSSLAGCKSERC